MSSNFITDDVETVDSTSQHDFDVQQAEFEIPRVSLQIRKLHSDRPELRHRQKSVCQREFLQVVLPNSGDSHDLCLCVSTVLLLDGTQHHPDAFCSYSGAACSVRNFSVVSGNHAELGLLEQTQLGVSLWIPLDIGKESGKLLPEEFLLPKPKCSL